MPLNRRDFLSSLTGLAGVAALPAHASTVRPSFQQAFAHPSPEAKPWIRWWWPGGVVDDAELRREIRLLGAHGFGGAEIQAFNPAIPKLTKDERARLHDYANPAYFRHLETCAEEAQAQGMQIDATFGSAWPSGGGLAITPELALIELTPALTSVRAPLAGPIRPNLPGQTRKIGAMPALDARTNDPRVADWRERIAAREKLVAVVAFKGEAPVLDKNKNYRSAVVKAAGSIDPQSSIVLTDKLRPDGTLDWVPPADGNWQIVVFKQFVVDSSVMAGVGEGPQLVLDHFKRAAFEAHARRVGDPLAPSGVAPKGMRATFIDSLELMPDIYWSEELLQEFKSRRGYDLTPHLPHLLQPGWMEAWNFHASPPYFESGDAGERIRADYRLTLSELLNENFWQPFVAWNRAHGLSARVQAHGGPSDLLQSYGMADIPETEDLESRGDTHFMRVARAAANLYGKKLVGCESLCWPGKAFETTPSQWQARINLLFASGVNAVVMHGFPYALHRESWPGWYPFAPSPFMAGFSSMLNEANPLWDAVGKLNTYITRLQSVLQRGRNVVPVAVYLGEIGYFHDLEPKTTHTLLEALLNGGYDYDRINDDCILKGRVVGRALLTPGGARYAALVLPARPSVRSATALQLARLAKAGLPIFYADRPPVRDEGFHQQQEQDRLVRDAVQATLDSGAQIAATGAMPEALRQAGIAPNLVFLGEPCLFVEKLLDGRSAYFFHNPQDKAIALRFSTRAAGNPERWNAFDGSREILASKRKGGRTEVAIDLAPGAGALVVFAARPALPSPSWVALESIDLGKRNWDLSVDGHGLRSRKIKQERKLDRLQDWSAIDGLADLSGHVTYATTVTLPASWLRQGHSIWLELGTVHDMAKVATDSASAATLIAPPFDADLTSMLRAGANRLQITVSNSPNNAMIDPKVAGLKDLKPKPAGLLGPVKLVLKQRKAAS